MYRAPLEAVRVQLNAVILPSKEEEAYKKYIFSKVSSQGRPMVSNLTLLYIIYYILYIIYYILYTIYHILKII